MNYLYYKITNTEPLKIANINTSQQGQFDTVRYIPGSTLQGAVIGKIAKAFSKEEFEERKKDLLGKLRFYNAYPLIEEQDGRIRALFPSPKGFYEEKASEETERGSQLANVFDTKELEGKKRAKLKDFCYLDRDRICYTDIKRKESMNIQVDRPDRKKNVFHSQMLKEGQNFYCCIAAEEGGEECLEQIKETIGTELWLGSDKSSGLGHCTVKECGEIPYGLPEIDSDVTGQIFLLLLSNTVMRNEQGELCGLDEKELGKLLGVERLRIEECSTSTIRVSGVNRTWGRRTPEVTMYEAGSMFQLSFDGILKADAIVKACVNGIGIRKHTGCGRIAFLTDISCYRYKKEIERKETTVGTKREPDEYDREVLKIAAKGLYLRKLERLEEGYLVNVRSDRSEIAGNQYGTILSMCETLKYSPQKAEKKFDEYFTHLKEKEKRQAKQKKAVSKDKLVQYVEKILKRPYEEMLADALPIQSKGIELSGQYDILNRTELCGIGKQELFTQEEEMKRKLRLLEKRIRYDMREAK